MSDHLSSARAKLASGDFAGMTPMEMQALAKLSANLPEPKAGKPQMLPALIEQILDITQPADRAQAREALVALMADKVSVVIEKTWSDDEIARIKIGP